MKRFVRETFTRENLRRFATRDVIIGSAVLSVLLIAGSAYGLYYYLPAASPPDLAAALTRIPGPTNTPRPPTGTPLPTSTATAEFVAPESGEIGVGSYVQIVGTEDTGLNIRNAPGLNSNIQFLGYDAEVFEVRDGPQEVEGFSWWYLVTPVDESRAGWAAANYLALVASN